MAYITNSEVVAPKLKTVLTPPSKKAPYEIPERYRNSFYLANAAFFDSTNWFLHRAFEVAFPTLKADLKKIQPELSNDEVAEKVEGMVGVLDQCNSVVDVRFPVRRESGKYEVVRGFRAQHGFASGYGASMGGFRINENITRDHMKALSVLTTYRNACMGINMAGAHGGLKICPTDYSEGELQNIVEQYASALIEKGYCTERDVIQPDVNSSAREMSWISRSFAKHTGSVYVAAVGKSPECGGLGNYNEMPSLGASVALDFILTNEQLMKKCGLTLGLKEKTFIIQGLGKLGTPLARLLVKNGAICVGVKDHDAYIYDAKGLDLEKLFEHKKQTGSIKNFGLCKEGTVDTIFTEQCDILVFSAYQKSLNCYVADGVKAKLILEAADGPVTPTAHRILTGRSKIVVPDIYSCSGGTVASYLEYLWNLQRAGGFGEEILSASSDVYRHALKQITCSEQNSPISAGPVSETALEVVPKTIKRVLDDIGKEILELVDIHGLGTDIRTAAYLVAIQNIFRSLYNHKKFF
ncbi:glutamate dehydrogenase, mitochondrial isoform X2 [Leptinotarsa decemlineata]|uniref:glutamate dehydrogenase, mitochondrial isoform X2 n=1 Tax=Leptinotarsa decemlineata TaxID=7539 RepID=UPI003D307913